GRPPRPTLFPYTTLFRSRGHVVLAGASPTGTFYAVQTLRQLIRTGPGRASVPSVHVRDWPGFGLRGGMESFYGPVWSQSDRLRQDRKSTRLNSSHVKISY